MTQLRRRYLILLLYAALALPFVVHGAISSLGANANSPIDWVPGTFPPRADFDRFRSAFGSGDILVVSWSECTVDEVRLDTLTRLLRRSKAFFDADGNWYFERVASGRELLQTLTTEPLSLEAPDAVGRLRGILLGDDGRTTCVVVALTPEGLKRRKDLVRLIRLAILRTCGVSDDECHFAGPVIDGLSVDEASRSALDRYSFPSAVIVLAFSALCLRSWKAAVLVFALAMYGQAATLALVHYCGDSMSALLIVMPPLIQVLTVSGGLHLVNYFFDAARNPSIENPGQRALELGWLPTVLSAGTTVLGLVSLMVSELEPIRAFGGYGAAGVCLSTALILAFIPGTLSLWPGLLERGRSDHRPGAGQLTETFTDRMWGNVRAGLTGGYGIVIVGAFALMGGAAIGLPRLQTSVRIETLFARDSRILRDYEWLETHVGPLVPIEVILHFKDSCGLSSADRFDLVQRVQSSLSELPEVGGTLSATSILPDLPAQFSDLPSDAQRSVRDRLLAAARPNLVEAHYLHESQGVESWRVTAQVPALGGTDYAGFLRDVRARVEPLIAKSGANATFTGIMPLVHEIQQQLLRDLLSSFLGALLVITAVMIVVQGGLLTGLVAMVSNLFPIVLVFGGLGWSGVPVDIGTIMTASIALGIAVDDTLHYLTFFRSELDSGRSIPNAVGSAYRHCGNAMIQTTVVNVLGLLVYGLSDFLPTSRFALLMAALLLLALAGDLFVLPALLLSPAGRLFLSLPDPTKTQAVAWNGQPHFEKLNSSVAADDCEEPEVLQPFAAWQED